MIAARRAATGDETLALIRAEGGSAISVQTDVTKRADVQAAVQAALDTNGGLDIVVHNASSGQSSAPTKCEEIDDARWDEQYAIALDAAFYLAQASFAHLRDTGRGRFIILSSAQALHGGAMNPIYASVKSAQRGMVKALAREWGPHDITVNGIAPAAETDATKAHFERHPQLREQILSVIPLRRLGDMRRRHRRCDRRVVQRPDALRDRADDPGRRRRLHRAVVLARSMSHSRLAGKVALVVTEKASPAYSAAKAGVVHLTQRGNQH